MTIKIVLLNYELWKLAKRKLLNYLIWLADGCGCENDPRRFLTPLNIAVTIERQYRQHTVQEEP